jgi:hypothetical protein
MPQRISISIIGWVASTLSVESLCSGGTQRRASWSSPSKFDEAHTQLEDRLRAVFHRRQLIDLP